LPKPDGEVAQQKPTGLTVVSVICLILGAIGTFTGLLGLVTTIFQSFAGDLQGMPGDPKIAEMQRKIQQLQQLQFVPNLVANGFNLLVGSLLFTGAIGVLGLKEWGRNLLRNALLVATIFAILRGIYMIWLQYRSIEVIKEIMPASQSGDAGVFAMVMQAGLILGVVIGLAWAAVLAGFYLWSRSYLNKPSIVSLFDASGK